MGDADYTMPIDNPAHMLKYLELAMRGTPLGRLPFSVNIVRSDDRRRAPLGNNYPDGNTPTGFWMVVKGRGGMEAGSGI